MDGLFAVVENVLYSFTPFLLFQPYKSAYIFLVVHSVWKVKRMWSSLHLMMWYFDEDDQVLYSPCHCGDLQSHLGLGNCIDLHLIIDTCIKHQKSSVYLQIVLLREITLTSSYWWLPSNSWFISLSCILVTKLWAEGVQETKLYILKLRHELQIRLTTSY